MSILNKDISTINYSDVVSFCEQQVPEGINLDYKKEFPSSIKKLIAAFSNSRGGLIIVGVGEDRKSGKPTDWEGVEEDASLIEKVHQHAISVTPLPTYEVRFTDAQNGKAFLLIRVMEGDNTPYYVLNDSNVWVKTGNIRNPIDIASPEWMELLYKKHDRAKLNRDNYRKLAGEVFDSGLLLEEKKRQRLIAEAKHKGEGDENKYFQQPLGTAVELITLQIQPFFPRKTLKTPYEILDNLELFRSKSFTTEFPKNDSFKPIPEGVMHFSHGWNGYIECQQIYSKGLMYQQYDILTTEQKGQKIIYISQILGGIFTLLLSANSYYSWSGYMGMLEFTIDIELQEKDIKIVKVFNPSGGTFRSENEVDVLLPSYKWLFTFSTADLKNIEEFKKKFIDIAKEIHWDLGFSKFDTHMLDSLFKFSR